MNYNKIHLNFNLQIWATQSRSELFSSEFQFVWFTSAYLQHKAGGGAGNEGNARGAGLLTAEKGKGRTWPWIEFQTTKTLQHPVT